MKNYDDIINTEWHGSARRAHMNLNLRAKIFMPFAALKGFDELLKQTQAAVETEMQTSSAGCTSAWDAP